MGEHVKPLGKAFVIDGEPRHKKYLVGNKQIRFTLNKDNGKWIVTVKDGTRHAEWESILVPGIEAARIIGEVAPRAFLAQTEEIIFVLSRIAKLNKKFPRATFDRIFRGKDGWTETRKKRLLRTYREAGFIKRKGKTKYVLTYDGSLELLERKEYLNDIKPRRPVEEQAPKRGRKKKVED